MPYLQLDLDAKRRVPLAARKAAITAAQFCWGLLELWESCWRDKSDRVSADMLALLFDADGPAVAGALVMFGFAESVEGDYRVRGADRYLRISESRSEGAKKTNAKRWGSDTGATAERPVSDKGATPERQGSDKGASLNVALTPNTEHRTPNTETPSNAGQSPPDSGAGFFATANRQREEVHRLPPEKPPRNPDKLGRWYGPALSEFQGDEAWMLAAHARFLADPFWRGANPPWPFAAFAKDPTRWAGPKPEPAPESCAIEGCMAPGVTAVWGRSVCVGHIGTAQEEHYGSPPHGFDAAKPGARP